MQVPRIYTVSCCDNAEGPRKEGRGWSSKDRLEDHHTCHPAERSSQREPCKFLAPLKGDVTLNASHLAPEYAACGCAAGFLFV